MFFEFVTETVLCCVMHARAMRAHVDGQLEFDHDEITEMTVGVNAVYL